MERKQPSCCKCGGGRSCPHCNGAETIKSGKTNANKQRYYCKKCRQRFITFYTYNAYLPDINRQIILFTKEGLGIHSTARVLSISTTTVLSQIISIAKSIKPPTLVKGRVYEVNEIRTCVGNKKTVIWIVYALDRLTKEVKSFNVGRRTNKTLRCVIRSLELSQAKRICTDRLKNYRYIIHRKIHDIRTYGTNPIERYNLTLRTHLKRLHRRSICFSKSIAVLSAILRIYFYG